jgi:hypothetical protein
MPLGRSVLVDPIAASGFTIKEIFLEATVIPRVIFGSLASHGDPENGRYTLCGEPGEPVCSAILPLGFLALDLVLPNQFRSL